MTDRQTDEVHVEITRKGLACMCLSICPIWSNTRCC